MNELTTIAAALNVDDWKNLLNGILTVLAIASSIVAKIKSDKAALLPVVIRGVENGDDDATKKRIENAALLAGVYDDLHSEVKKITKPKS